MRVLVTGCAGFIGSNLTDYLLSCGHEVFGIDSFTDYYSRAIKELNISAAISDNNFHFIKGDILNVKDLPDVDVIFHLAAQAGVRASWGKTFEIYSRNNVEATQTLLEYYKGKGIKKFVYSSSSSIYGDARLPMNEESLPKPISPYGVTKLAAENLCYLYYKNFGIPTISLRYFTVYGPRLRPDMGIYKFVDNVLNGREIVIYGDGMQTRDFTFVEDVIQANILAAECSVNGQNYNIGGGSNISVNKLLGLIESILHKKPNIKYASKQKGDVENTLADISKAKRDLRWEPKTCIQDGLLKYIDWYLGQRS